MKRFSLVPSLLLLAVLAAGCISFDYEGEVFPAVDEAMLYDSPDAVPRAYEVIGKAAAAGDYRDVSLEQLQKKLRAEAAKRGADAAIVTASQVIPTGEALRKDAGLGTMAATESEQSGGGINQLYRDFQGGYGTILDDGSGRQQLVHEYRRILRADFIRYQAPAAATGVAEE